MVFYHCVCKLWHPFNHLPSAYWILWMCFNHSCASYCWGVLVVVRGPRNATKITPYNRSHVTDLLSTQKLPLCENGERGTSSEGFSFINDMTCSCSGNVLHLVPSDDMIAVVELLKISKGSTWFLNVGGAWLPALVFSKFSWLVFSRGLANVILFNS